MEGEDKNRVIPRILGSSSNYGSTLFLEETPEQALFATKTIWKDVYGNRNFLEKTQNASVHDFIQTVLQHKEKRHKTKMPEKFCNESGLQLQILIETSLPVIDVGIRLDASEWLKEYPKFTIRNLIDRYDNIPYVVGFKNAQIRTFL
jgi:hypothetical protein